MRKLLTAGLAALTLTGSLAATTAPAQAYPHGGYHGGGYHHGGGWHGGNGAGWAVGAGLLGLAAGAAIANSYDHDRYYDRGYGGGYYGSSYYDDGGYGYQTCVSHRRVWDPYAGGYVMQSFRYAC